MARAKVTTLNLSNWLHFESIVRLKFASNSEEGEEEEEDEDEKREREKKKKTLDGGSCEILRQVPTGRCCFESPL